MVVYGSYWYQSRFYFGYLCEVARYKNRLKDKSKNLSHGNEFVHKNPRYFQQKKHLGGWNHKSLISTII
jgi:hypothetical protein